MYRIDKDPEVHIWTGIFLQRHWCSVNSSSMWNCETVMF